MVIGRALFIDWDLSNYLRSQEGGVEGYVRQNMTEADLDRTDKQIVERLLPQALVEPLIIDFDHPEKDAQEARVEVRDMFSGTAMIDGVRATRSFAFSGDPSLLNMKTNPFTSVLPRGEVVGQRVILGMEGRNDAATLKGEIDNQEKLLREYVGWSTDQVKQHNERLPGLLATSVAQRRQHLSGLADLKNRI